MTTLPESGIGQENELEPQSLWQRARIVLGTRMTYAFADQVTYSFGNMVVAALLSRHAHPEFGAYILTQRALDMIFQLCNVFLWGPFAFNLPATEEGRRSLYRGSIFLHQILCCGATAFIFWGASVWSLPPSRALYHSVFAPLVVTSIGILFREYTRRMYFAEMQMKEAFWTDVVTVVLQIAGVEFLYATHRLNVATTLIMLSFGAIVVSLWWFLREWRKLAFGLRAALDDARRNTRLGRWFLGANMVFMVSSQCNPWLLSWLLGGNSVGDYAVCESVVNIPRVALTSMQNVMAPVMAQAYAGGGKRELRKIVRQYDKLLFAGSAVFAAGIALFGPWVAQWIFKTVPGNSRAILIVLALNFVAYAATMAQSYGLTAIDKADYTFYANLIGLTAQIAVSILLVRMFHVPGAAAALLVGSIVVVAARQLFYTRQMRAEPVPEPQSA